MQRTKINQQPMVSSMPNIFERQMTNIKKCTKTQRDGESFIELLLWG